MAASVVVAVPTPVLFFVFRRQLVESIKTSSIKLSTTIQTTFNRLGMSPGNLSLLSAAQTRSIGAFASEIASTMCTWPDAIYPRCHSEKARYTRQATAGV
jgi:hypothetical protein